MKRRRFVGGVVAGVATLSRRTHGSKLKAGDIPKRTFGKTGERLTLIGQAGGRFGMIPFEEAKAITLRAYDLGVNYFDNAHDYWDGRSEEVFGAVLPPYRKEVFITTKSLQRSREGAERELHLSLKRLRTDYVDLWQIHSVTTADDVQQIFAPGGAIEAFEAARQAGQCRFIGFTGHFDPNIHMQMLAQYKHFDTILLPTHAADPSYFGFETLVLEEAQRQNLGIQGMKTFANAQLLQSFTVRECLTYALSLPIHCVAVGCTTIGQLEDDVRIAQQMKPYSKQQMAELRERGQPLAGPDLEGWKRNILTESSPS